MGPRKGPGKGPMTTAQQPKKTYELSVQTRDILGKQTHKLRKQGLVPAIVYGHRIEPVPVVAELKELERVYMRAGTNSLVDLTIGDGGQAQKVFIHNVQRDPISQHLQHVDFVVVNLREEVTTTVPLVLVGEAPGADGRTAILVHPIDHLQVRALPTEIPPLVEVDVSGLEEIDQAIYVSDLTVPSNIHVLNPPEELVVKLSALRVTVEEEEAAEAAEEAAEEAASGEAGEEES